VFLIVFQPSNIELKAKQKAKHLFVLFFGFGHCYFLVQYFIFLISIMGRRKKREEKKKIKRFTLFSNFMKGTDLYS